MMDQCCPPVLAQEAGHWQRYAGHWSKVAPPLCPHADDLSVYARELDARVPTLLLGVTPQIVALDYLHGVAVDRNLDMIQAHPPAPDRWRVLQANWLALPLSVGAVGQAVGDGVLSMLHYPHDYLRLFKELRRVIRSGGNCVLRLFVAPEQSETVHDICADLVAGNIGNFHVLKWRLMMSLCSADTAYKVRVTDALALFNQHFTDRAALLRLTGWPADVYDTIDVYQGSDLAFSFVPRSALDALFGQFAKSVSYYTGSYALAERCPIVVLQGLHS